ncbi:T9SS-dependent M6-like inactivated metalloprotease [Rhodohalobacter sp. 8-1]|uniref:T9SS-dependent M6-like inactivated metalloprotease n=1 Tax=Rhodohalobacter sp. 8-1 TaxID=3131972 RepID=UPI0030EE7D28
MALSTLVSSTSRGIVLLIFLFLGPDHLYSQVSLSPYSVASKVNSVSNSTLSDGTLHIVAVRVEFQPDTTRFTSGDGTFSDDSIPYLQNESVTIDPLPHDKPYFEAHLEFAKNYFSRMSDGALNISYQLLDDVYRLPQRMETYSPIGEDPGSEPLADLARDAWENVAESGNLELGLNPGDQIAFVLFHAGVGRDIELTGTILDKTPQDIPSVYISRDAFGRLFDDPSFSGFPIDNGNLLVDNTLILPRTLTRAGEDVTGSEVILQLSINGMVTAQIGSHIGLPDLFNTETGESGIGRFGLMDGAGIFAYNGLFPPELSAWEKKHMGWADPVEIDYNHDGAITLPASSLRQPNSIAKVSLSSQEYFLIENRHREADGNGTGTTLTFQRPNGSRETRTYTNTDTTFVFQLSDFSEELIPGVVVDVSNYDFALPGGPAEVLEETDGNDERILNGGMLIWHIDEGIIQQRLSANRGINDDPDAKGVNLMEADGAQDIGRPTAIGFFENEVNGSAFDFWWSGNDASVITSTQTITLYENRFGPDTTPDNDSNSGAESPFELFDFSDNLPLANVNIQPFNTGENLYEVIETTRLGSLGFSTPANDPYWNSYPLSIVALTGDRESESVIPSRNGLLYRFSQGDILGFTENYSPQQPLVTSNYNIFALAPNPASSSQEFVVKFIERNRRGFSSFWEFAIEPNQGFVSSPVPNFVQFDGTDTRATIASKTIEPDFYSAPGFRTAQIQGYESFLSNDGEISITTPSGSLNGNMLLPNSPYSKKHIGLIENQDGTYKTYLLIENDIILIDTESGSDMQQRVLHSSEHLEWPALVDLNASGNIDFIFVDRERNEIVAKNLNGAVLSGFPIQAPEDAIFRGTPLISDIDSNGEPDFIIAAQASESLNLYAYNSDGDPIEGFPLLVGGYPDTSVEFIHPAMNDEYLTAVSPAGDFRVWRFPNAQNTQWESRYGNGGTNNLTGRLLDSDVQEPAFTVLNKQETYNWPNPASDETYVRFQTSEPGDVQIRITTTSGRLIYNQTHPSRGGSPEEIRIDTSGWGSGGYLAVIEATVNGDTERKLVKIAVAR